jgi:hypothetical protein
MSIVFLPLIYVAIGSWLATSSFKTKAAQKDFEDLLLLGFRGYLIAFASYAYVALCYPFIIVFDMNRNSLE